MLDNDVWNGPSVGPDGHVTILSDVERIVFPKGLDVKGLVAMTCHDIILGKASRIRHIRTGGNVTCFGELLFADIGINGDLIVDGNVLSWLSGIVMPYGSIMSTRTIRSAGEISAPNGVVVADEGIRGETRPIDIKAIEVIIPGRLTGVSMRDRQKLADRLEHHRRSLSGIAP